MRLRAAAWILPVMLIAAPAHAAHWQVDRTRSHLGFSVLWSNEPFSGEFQRWNAEITFDPADLGRAHAAVTVDLGSEHSDEAEFDDGLKGALGFQISKFPVAKFTTTKIVSDAPGHYVAVGSLSLRGISKDITVPFALTVTGTEAHMTGRTDVLRTDFGIGRGMWEAPEPVAHAVTVIIDLTATKTK